jgi:hypothetical protein
MPESTYSVVRSAAASLDRSDTKCVWRLADAILAHVPATTDAERTAAATAVRTGNVNPRAGGDVAALLATLARDLTADGVFTPKGDPYSVGTLSNLREVAMAWPADDRHPEAAFRTHQEASNPTRRRILAALCAVARGETVRRPNGLDSSDWQRAVDRVRARTNGFAVTANDLRISEARPTNNTGATRTPRPADVPAAIAEHGAAAVVAEMSTTERAEVADAIAEREARERVDAGLVEAETTAAGIAAMTAWAKFVQAGQKALRAQETFMVERRDEDVITSIMRNHVEIRDILDASVLLSRGITDADVAELLGGAS